MGPVANYGAYVLPEDISILLFKTPRKTERTFIAQIWSKLVYN